VWLSCDIVRFKTEVGVTRNSSANTYL